MGVNNLTEVKGAGKYPSRRYGKRERKLIKDLSGPARIVTALYDFSVDGGAVGAVDLDVTIPAGAIVTRVWTDELTNVTSGGAAEVAIEVGAQVIVAAAVASGLSGAQAQTVASGPVKITTAANLELVISVAALTAGKVRVFCEFIQSES